MYKKSMEVYDTSVTIMVHHPFLLAMSPLLMLANYANISMNRYEDRSIAENMKSKTILPVNNKIKSESQKNFKKNTTGFPLKIKIDRSVTNRKDLEQLNELFWFEEPKKQLH